MMAETAPSSFFCDHSDPWSITLQTIMCESGTATVQMFICRRCWRGWTDPGALREDGQA